MDPLTLWFSSTTSLSLVAQLYVICVEYDTLRYLSHFPSAGEAVCLPVRFVARCHQYQGISKSSWMFFSSKTQHTKKTSLRDKVTLKKGILKYIFLRSPVCFPTADTDLS